MAVTLTVEQFIADARIGATAEELELAGRRLDYAAVAVVKYAPDAPNEAHNQAASMLASYLYDQPTASVGTAFANAMRSSGASRVLLPYRIHRIGLSEAVGAAQAAVGTSGNPVTGLSVERDQLVVAFADGTTEQIDLPSGRDVGQTDIFDLRLPGAAVAMRMGWTLGSMQVTEETFIRDGNHPDDGAAEGTTAGLLTPPIPISDFNLTTGQQYRFHIWIAGDVELAALIGPYGDNWFPEFPLFGDLEVDGVAGMVYSERHTRHNVDGLYSFSGIIPGDLIATQPWVRNIAGIAPSGDGIDQDARDAAVAAQTTADGAVTDAASAQQSADTNTGNITDNANAITALPALAQWAEEGNPDLIPHFKVATAQRGTKVHVETSLPATGLLGDIVILDLTTTSPRIYEWTSSGWHLDYTFQGGRVHVVTSAHNIAMQTPVANGGDVLFELVSGTLKMYRRLNANSAPFWFYVGEVAGGAGADQTARDAANAAQTAADAAQTDIDDYELNHPTGGGGPGQNR